MSLMTMYVAHNMLLFVYDYHAMQLTLNILYNMMLLVTKTEHQVERLV